MYKPLLHTSSFGPIGWLAALLLLFGCEATPMLPEEEATVHPSGVTLLLAAASSEETDSDANLPEEYAILNLSIFMADAGSETFSDKFVYQSFTAVPGSGFKGCQQVRLPLDPATVGHKDIYVIANYDNVAGLSAINTLSDLKALRTPRVAAGNKISIERGLPMYGESLDVDLSGSATQPVQVDLIRTCAKIEFTLSFPDPSWVGTNSRFTVLEAQSYTYFVPNSDVVPLTDLVQYPQIILTPQPEDPSVFKGIVYIYESKYHLSFISIQTVIGGKSREYVIDKSVPLPVRNQMYSVLVEILHPLTGPDALTKLTATF
ncbi:MAG: hypothetical protein LBM20_07885 [Rikenellaceae bacterium]|jgi:hypothetical protein|nr:hypothetical protein [Rikenellaceae bacterium]